MIDRWVADLNSPSLDARLAAENALISAGAGARAAVVAATFSPDVEMRWRACSILGDLAADDDGACGARLALLLADDAGEVRSSAAYSLGLLAPAAAFEALHAAAWVTNPDEQTPFVSALALLRIDRERGAGLLAEAAAGAAEATARIALTALAHVRWAGVV